MEQTKIENTWRPVVRKSRQIPFGYEADPNDDTILLPIQEQLDALLEAKEYLKTCSYREVSRWLSAKTGRTITYQALHKLVTKERDRQRAFLDCLFDDANGNIRTAMKIAGYSENTKPSTVLQTMQE